MATLPEAIAAGTVTQDTNPANSLYAYWTDGVSDLYVTIADLLKNPGAIGSGTPNSGAFTTLSSTGAASLDSLTLTTDLAVTHGGTGASTASGARTNLGLVIGTNVQAWDANLDQLAALSSADGNFIVGSATGWVAESGAAARTSLGLGTSDNVTFNNVTANGTLGVTGAAAFSSTVALPSDALITLGGDDRVYFRKSGKTDGGGGDQFLFGDFDGWSAAAGGAALGLANNFHAWWDTPDPVRVEFESNVGEMQFYIEAGSGKDAWYGLQEGATHHWSFGFDANDAASLKFFSGFSLAGTPELIIRKNGGGSRFLYDLDIDATVTVGTTLAVGTTLSVGSVSNLHQSISAHRTALIGSEEDAFLQIASNNAGSVGTGLILTNQEGASDGRHWVIQHRGTTASNAFQIGYDTTVADGENIATGATTYFTISTAGAFSLNGATTIDSTLTLASGSITDSGGAISFGNENLSTTGKWTIGDGLVVSVPTVIDVANQANASILFGNNGTSLPSIVGKTTAANTQGLFLIAATNNSNTAFDFEFNIRESDGTDYGTTTGAGFRWRRFATELARLDRAGNLTLTAGGSITTTGTLASGNATVTGTLTTTGNVSTTQSLDGDLTHTITNVNAGTSARAFLRVASGGGGASFTAYSSTYASVSNWADSAGIVADSSLDGGIFLFSSDKVRIQNAPGTDAFKVEGGNTTVTGTLGVTSTVNLTGGKLNTAASTTARASLNVPSGTAPTSPTNGDIWSDGSDLLIRLGGTTYTLQKA